MNYYMSVSKHTTFLSVPYMKKFNVKSFLFVGMPPPPHTINPYRSFFEQNTLNTVNRLIYYFKVDENKHLTKNDFNMWYKQNLNKILKNYCDQS